MPRLTFRMNIYLLQVVNGIGIGMLYFLLAVGLSIIFGLLGETLEITVRASNRDCYAHGALAAAKFLADKQPGLYNMNDVLGL